MTDRKKAYAKPTLVKASIVGVVGSSPSSVIGDSQAAPGAPITNATLS